MPEKQPHPRSSQSPLIGLCFHSFTTKDGKKTVRWQGQVVAAIEPGFYLVEVADWISGMNMTKQVVKLDTMQDWDFYDTAEEMRTVYETTWAKR
jgi:hypothetical protein